MVMVFHSTDFRKAYKFPVLVICFVITISRSVHKAMLK